MWNREPVAILATLHALIALAIGFGLSISPEQFGLVEVALAAVLGLVARSQVSPA